MSILADFINARQKEYVEPVRKGTPRDEERGLTRPKYKMALLALTNLSTAKIAPMCGTTTEQVINYRRRPGFQRVVEEEIKKFSAIFVDAFLKRIVEQQNLLEDQQYSMGYYEDLYEDFLDYGQQLKIEIINSLKGKHQSLNEVFTSAIKSKSLSTLARSEPIGLRGIILELSRINLLAGKRGRVHKKDREENERILKTQLELYKFQVAETHEFILMMLERYDVSDEDMKKSLKGSIAYEKGLRDAISSIQEEFAGISKDKK